MKLRKKSVKILDNFSSNRLLLKPKLPIQHRFQEKLKRKLRNLLDLKLPFRIKI